jgi:hypothetical protein
MCTVVFNVVQKFGFRYGILSAGDMQLHSGALGICPSCTVVPFPLNTESSNTVLHGFCFRISGIQSVLIPIVVYA